jgi:hypothetical protein
VHCDYFVDNKSKLSSFMYVGSLCMPGSSGVIAYNPVFAHSVLSTPQLTPGPTASASLGESHTSALNVLVTQPASLNEASAHLASDYTFLSDEQMTGLQEEISYIMENEGAVHVEMW